MHHKGKVRSTNNMNQHATGRTHKKRHRSERKHGRHFVLCCFPEFRPISVAAADWKRHQ
jgi:hypothetical protein